MESEITYADGIINNNWKPEDIEYLISNASHFTTEELAWAVKRGTRNTREKLSALGLAGAYKGRISEIAELGYIPDGMNQKRSTCGTGGMIYRIPCSTPGIVSRTIHVSGIRAETEENHAG